MVGALFLLEVDHFKRDNDFNGHGAGDAVSRFLPTIPRSGVDEIAHRILT